MSSHFLAHHAKRAKPPDPQRLARPDIDWRALRNANRACCCPARPAIVAVMPSAPGRDHRTDLLLCGHHYRLSRAALAAAGAIVLDQGGMPVSPRTAALAAAR